MSNQSERTGNILEKAADVVADLMQSIFLFLLKPFVPIARRMSDRVKGFLISASFFIMMVIIYLEHTNITSLILGALPLPSIIKYVFFDLVCCVLMAVIAVASIRGPLQKKRCNAMMTLLWTGMCVFFLVSAIYTSLDWAAISIIFAFVFPCVFFIWNNRGDYGTLFSLFTRGVVVFNVIFFVASILLSPITGSQYRAMFTNSNSLGQYLSFTMPLFLIQYTLAWKKDEQRTFTPAPEGLHIKHPVKTLNFVALYLHERSERVWSLIGLGTAAAFVLFSRSRTAFIAFIVSFALWFVLHFLVEHGKEGVKSVGKMILRRVLPIVLVVVICVPVTFGLVKCGTFAVYAYAATNNLLPDEYQYLNPFLNKTKLDSTIADFGDRLDMEGKDADQVSTHRTTIWNAFLNRVEPFGHERGKIYVHDYGIAATTHNCIIQILYDSGIFTALFYFAINVAAGFRALLYFLRRRKGDPYAMFPVLMMPGFLVTSLLASSYPPFAYGVALAYWLVMAPLFEKKIEKLEG